MSFTGFDPEAAKHTEGEFRRQGIQLKPDFSPVKVVKEKDGKLTMTAKNNKDEEITLDGIDYILMATGRKPATQGLGLDKVCGTAMMCSSCCVVFTGQISKACLLSSLLICSVKADSCCRTCVQDAGGNPVHYLSCAATLSWHDGLLHTHIRLTQTRLQIV